MKSIPLIAKIAFAMSGLLTVTGCAPLRSQAWCEGDPQPAGLFGRTTAGQTYFLPKCRIAMKGAYIAGKEAPTNYQVTVTREMQPDKSRRYYVRHTGNWLYEDGIILEVNSEHLLQGDQKADAKDKLPDSLISLGKSAVYAWQIYSSLNPASPLTDEGALPKFREFDFSFDPTNADEVKSAEDEATKAGFILVVSPGPSSAGKETMPLCEPSPKMDNGLFYRPPTTVKVSLKAQTTFPPFSRNAEISIPNKREIAILPVKRMPFVAMAQKGNFEAGALKKVELTQPSPIHAIISIPESILEAASKAIPGTLDNRVKSRSDERARQTFDSDLAAALAENEKKLLEAQVAIAKAQVDILKQKEALAVATAEAKKVTDEAAAVKKTGGVQPVENPGLPGPGGGPLPITPPQPPK